jgi:hypothetical protein
VGLPVGKCIGDFTGQVAPAGRQHADDEHITGLTQISEKICPFFPNTP